MPLAPGCNSHHQDDESNISVCRPDLFINRNISYGLEESFECVRELVASKKKAPSSSMLMLQATRKVGLDLRACGMIRWFLSDISQCLQNEKGACFRYSKNSYKTQLVWWEYLTPNAQSMAYWKYVFGPSFFWPPVFWSLWSWYFVCGESIMQLDKGC